MVMREREKVQVIHNSRTFEKCCYIICFVVVDGTFFLTVILSLCNTSLKNNIANVQVILHSTQEQLNG
jgi:hypothetical protein